MVEFREILLQFLIACLPAFLFPLLYEKSSRIPQPNGRQAYQTAYSMGLTYTCTFSMLLCSLFPSYVWNGIPINFGILPLFALMLYGKLREGIILAVLYLLLYPLYAVRFTVLEFLLETEVFLYPFVLLNANYFKRISRRGKVVVLTVIFAIGEIVITVSPYIIEEIKVELGAIVTIISNILVSVLAGSLFVHIIETTMEKEKLREQVMHLSRKYFREAETLQQMMDAAPLSITLLDQKGRIVSVNDAFLQFYRLSRPSGTRDDLIRKEMEKVMQGLDFEIIASRAEQTLEGNVKTSEILQSADRVFYATTSPITKMHTNENIGAVIIVQDITELEALRMELNHVERLGLVGQMAASITHEIRNPMAVVRGFLQLMREKSPASLEHYYRIVMEELDRANGIINDFLSLAQNRVVKMEMYRLDEIISELTPLLWADANLRGQSIEVRLDENAPLLMLNHKEIKQLILNLGRNAMEAMGEKGKLTLEMKLQPEGVELYVTDTGPGIPPAQKERLFEPFFTTKSKGTGLGLSLCLSIMERHGGRIHVESEEGLGTTFIVFFPFVSERIEA
ncbi:MULTISPECIES: two-component system sensor histidine kinase NtrB [unclassified Paenibacillus]|uniref:two-component system sensor histidine kinase NtrB n=1 Tax=unclassified Paenibacillus TaxID=185978 RepID=UPI000838DD17|nr:MULTISPECIES: ATP-binding protein [unclassified Paenibacillus]NWL89680.1 PAS domain-containing sensor histidine kinase [Paenibacillus sp. 79R4]